MWACQQFVLLKFLSNLNLNMVYGTFYVNHDVSKCRFSCLQIYIKPWMLVILLCDRLDCNESGVAFFLCVFLFFFFFFSPQKLTLSTVNSSYMHCSQVSQIPLFSNFFIKNGSHDTIYTFKNYLATVFLISIFSFSNNKLNPNGPCVSMHKDPVGCKTTLLCMGESFSYSLHRESNKNYNLVRINLFISF